MIAKHLLPDVEAAEASKALIPCSLWAPHQAAHCLAVRLCRDHGREHLLPDAEAPEAVHRGWPRLRNALQEDLRDQ